MATAYSDDLRRKLLEAHQRGEGSLAQLAARFSVSEGWARKISAQLYRTGQMERPPGGRRGPASKITPEIERELQDWIARQSDLTLAELQLRLAKQHRLKVSVSRLWTVLKRLGLQLKKSRSVPRNKTPKRAAGSGHNGFRTARKLTRRT